MPRNPLPCPLMGEDALAGAGEGMVYCTTGLSTEIGSKIINFSYEEITNFGN